MKSAKSILKKTGSTPYSSSKHRLTKRKANPTLMSW